MVMFHGFLYVYQRVSLLLPLCRNMSCRNAADVSPTFTQIPRHPEALSADAIDQVLVEGAVDEERRMRHIEDLRGPRVVSFGTAGSLVME